MPHKSFPSIQSNKIKSLQLTDISVNLHKNHIMFNDLEINNNVIMQKMHFSMVASLNTM